MMQLNKHRFCTVSVLLITLVSLSACSPAAEKEKTKGYARIFDLDAEVKDDSKVDVNGLLKIELTPELEKTASKGVALYFSLETKLIKKRRWWFDKTVTSKTVNWRIQYNALLRQWVVDSSGNYMNEFSMQEALNLINGRRSWELELNKPLLSESDYQVQSLFKLDTSRLPGPFQIYTFSNNSDWSLSSKWKNFDLNVSVDKQS